MMNAQDKAEARADEELVYKEGYRIGMLTACEAICPHCRKGDIPKYWGRKGLYIHSGMDTCLASKILYLMGETTGQHQGDQKNEG